MVSSFYPPYHVGGACVHVYHLANALAKEGHQIHVLYSKDAYRIKRRGKPSLKSYPNHENIRLHDIESICSRGAVMFTYVTGFPASRKMKLLFDQDFDLIHYHNISLLGPQVLRYGDAHKIYTAHDHWLLCPYNDYFTRGKVCNVSPPSPLTCSFCLMRNKRPPQFWRFSNKLKDALREIDLIISPSRYLKSFYHKYGIEQPITVLPNFVPNPPEVAQNPPGKDYFFYAGMLEEIKGISNLLKVFRGIDEKLVIAGKGSLEPAVRRAAENGSNIVYANWLNRDEMYTYYSNARAFILPSLCPENFPLTILEAYSVGTPAMGSNIGGIPEIIGQVNKNLLFQPHDNEEFAHKVKHFSREAYSKKQIKDLFHSNYSHDNYIKEYLKLVNSILD